ncbi:MAG: cation transporter [Chloroflexota bacterium]
MAIRRQSRAGALRQGLVIEAISIIWMAFEAIVAIDVGITARSGAALAFGLDSVIELGSAGVLVWRLRAEFAASSDEEIETAERKAGRIVGAALLGLAGYVILQSIATLLLRIEPEPSVIGIGLAALALVGMPILARVKRQVAGAIESPALRGDAACSITCAYMAATLLGGLAVNALFGWWWADPLAALGIVYFLIREGREAWNGDDCCNDCRASQGPRNNAPNGSSVNVD